MTPQEFFSEVQRIRKQPVGHRPIDVIHNREAAIRKLAHHLSEDDLLAILTYRSPNPDFPKELLLEMGRAIYAELDSRAEKISPPQPPAQTAWERITDDWLERQ